MMLHVGNRKTIRAVMAGVARLLLLPTLAWAGICSAQELAPRSQWQASSSSQQVATMAIGHLIDNDPKTVTGGAFSPGHWFQIDVGRPALLGGVRITWDVSNPEGYTLQTSLDGKQWDLAYTMGDSLGGVETLFFAPRQARTCAWQAPNVPRTGACRSLKWNRLIRAAARAWPSWAPSRPPRCGGAAAR